MADTKSTAPAEAVETTEAAAPEKRKGPNGTQISAVFSDEQKSRIDELRWIGRHDKVSDVLKAAVDFYAEAKLGPVEGE